MKIFIYSFLVLLSFQLLSCSKSDELKSSSYWGKRAQEKKREINLLSESVPCQDISTFKVVFKHNYFLVHPTIQARFDRLLAEYDDYFNKMLDAAAREGIIYDFLYPIPPIKVVCRDGKATMLFVQDLTIQEVNEELPKFKNNIMDFYKDVNCTDPSEWGSMILIVNCNYEGFAIHKKIRNKEFHELLLTYYELNNRKNQLENIKCDGMSSNKQATISCKEGKPVVTISN